jgi:hypothetical protein
MTNNCINRSLENFPAVLDVPATSAQVYEAIVASSDIAISHSLAPRYPLEHLGNLRDGVALNLGFCYVTDRSPRQPLNATYHFQVADGILWSLPTKTRTALVIGPLGMEPVSVEAFGWLQIAGSRLDWIGSHERSPHLGEAVAFGLSHQSLTRSDGIIVAQRELGLVEPLAGHLNVCLGPAACGLEVVEITDRSVSVLDYVVVLRVPASLAREQRVGDQVVDWQVGQFRCGSITQAVTVGARLWPSPEKTFRQVEAERVVMSRHTDGRPYFASLDVLKARSAIFEDVRGKIHLVVVDAEPGVPGRDGVTLSQLGAWIHERGGINWAVSVDGGQSAKLIVAEAGRRWVYGNLHYRNHLGPAEQQVGRYGRPVTTCLLAHSSRVN